MYTMQEATHSAITESIRGRTHRTEPILGANIASEIAAIPASAPALTVPVGVSPDDSNYNGAALAVRAAMSYWMAKSSGTIAWTYHDGYGPLKPTNADGTGELSDASGNAIADCSTYIGLVLRGLDYLSSPYAKITGASQTYNPQNIVAADNAWAEKYFDLQKNSGVLTYSHQTADGHYRVITAADMAAYYARMNLTWWPGEREVKPGDLCFFYKALDDGSLKYPGRYLGISHVGIMINGDKCLNITDYPTSGNLIVTTMNTETSRHPYLYARPLYGALTDGASADLTPGAVDLLPEMWAGVPQTQKGSAANGVTFYLSGKSLTLSGTTTAGFTKDLISASCPLHLPAGTYKLSGFVNGSGTNTVSASHSVWGLRVYDADTGAGITGTTTSSDGNNTYVRAPVWDVGGGAVFTLTEATNIKINMWLPGDKDVSKLSAVPVLYRK